MNGFFLGGVAEGMDAAGKRQLAERTQAQDFGLRSRALDIEEQRLRSGDQQKSIERGDALISFTMTKVTDAIREGLAAGKDPIALQALVRPMVESAKQVAARVGRDPSAIDAQVSATLGQPNIVETATAAGQAAAAKTVAQENALTAAGVSPNRFESHDKRVSAENALRDDYTKQSANFVVQRDAKNRIDTIYETGAGDMALVFTYMKLLDPTSTVREGEYATAVNAAGVPSTVRALVNKITGGGTLDEKARREIKQQANAFYGRAAMQHDKLTTQFANIAKNQGLRVDNVIVDQAPAAGWQTTPNGTRFRVNDPLGIRDVPQPPPGFQMVR